MEGRRRFSFRLAIWTLAACAGALLLTGPASASVAPRRGTLARGPLSLSVRGHGMGLIKTTPPPVTAAERSAVHAEAASLPASVDLSTHAMPVGNQGGVGSCAAWAADYTALGYWENTQGIPGGGLAPMYTYSQVTGGHDYGSTIEGNLSIDEKGVDNQTDYYQGNYDYTDMPAAGEKANAVNWKLTGFSNLPVQMSSSSTVTQQSIETALAAGLPVVIGIPVYSNFFSVGSANHGYYADVSGNFAGNHAITALGYNSQGLVIENSWGTGWGDAGWATLSWSFVNGHVFDAVSVSPLHTGQPVSTVRPSLPYTAREGVTLTAPAGTWAPAATSYAYQWQRAGVAGNWANIAGATTAGYTPGTADLGQYLRVLITASNASGPGAITSVQTGTVLSGAPADSVLPAVSGSLSVGQSLTSTTGTWNPAGTSWSYQWQRLAGGAWANILGATGSVYKTTAADASTSLRVKVTETNAWGSTTAYSGQVGPISGVPVDASAPSVVGTPVRGTTLTVNLGSWYGAPPSYTYQWQKYANGSGWSNISGATASTYSPLKGDENSVLRVQVTGTNSYGQAVAMSAATAAVKANPPVNTAAPTVLGIAALGHTLSISVGVWSGAGNAYAYQWQHYVGGAWSAIPGATGVTYAPTSSDHGATIRALVTATNVDGSATVASPATVKVP